jgi:hypothetical protein
MSVNIYTKKDGLVKIAGLDKADDMIGATDDAQGKNGLVPTPLISDKNRFLKGDGTWADLKAKEVEISNDEPSSMDAGGIWIVLED